MPSSFGAFSPTVAWYKGRRWRCSCGLSLGAFSRAPRKKTSTKWCLNVSDLAMIFSGWAKGILTHGLSQDLKLVKFTSVLCVSFRPIQAWLFSTFWRPKQKLTTGDDEGILPDFQGLENIPSVGFSPATVSQTKTPGFLQDDFLLGHASLQLASCYPPWN